VTSPPPVAVILASGYWVTQAGDASTAPGDGTYQADNWAAPALLAVSYTDADGYDRGAGLLAIAPGDPLVEQGAADSQDFQQWTVTSVTDQGTWVQLGVQVALSGSAFTAPGVGERWLLQALQPQPSAPPWQLWAPPLDPPTAGGLPVAVAEGIATAYWGQSPHLAAALMWEAYAGMLPPTPAVSSVSTGAQSVAYSPAAPTGAYGLAVARAAWHRSFIADELVVAPLCKAPPYYYDLAGYVPWWVVNDPEAVP
jgi:hypothetical protein